MLVVTEVLSIDSKKVTEILSLIETELLLSVGEVERTVGAITSIINVLILSGLLVFSAESVTVIEQLLYKPALKVPNEIELVPLIADVSPWEQPL